MSRKSPMTNFLLARLTPSSCPLCPAHVVPISLSLYTGALGSGYTIAKSKNVPFRRASGFTSLTRLVSSFSVASSLQSRIRSVKSVYVEITKKKYITPSKKLLVNKYLCTVLDTINIHSENSNLIFITLLIYKPSGLRYSNYYLPCTCTMYTPNLTLVSVLLY